MKRKWIFWPVLLLLMMVIGPVALAQDVATDQSAPPPVENQAIESSEKAEQMPSLTESVLPSLTRIAISLCVIVAIIYLTVFLLKKLSGSRAGGKKGTTIQIIEQPYLAHKKSVCLLKLADRAVLVGTTENSMNLLTELEWDALPQETIEKNSRVQAGFPGFLNEAAGKLFGGKGSKGAKHESAV